VNLSPAIAAQASTTKLERERRDVMVLLDELRFFVVGG
jgi:hypothetical protein